MAKQDQSENAVRLTWVRLMHEYLDRAVAKMDMIAPEIDFHSKEPVVQAKMYVMAAAALVLILRDQMETSADR